nr:retrovirus-related Pol polyprotein from transposon TNT 1-94 [Tanacetum cinerariifolium]
MSLLSGLITPPMLDKSNYSSWASRILLYIKGKPNGKLLVDSVLNGPFQFGTILEPRTGNTPLTEICDRVKLLIQGLELSLQEQESKLYDDFNIFTSMPGEIIHSYYMRFAQLINDMHTIGMTMKPLQVNTKFVNHFQPEWSKFVTDVKLAKDMHTTNFDHLYAHLRQHEAHANEVHLERQSWPSLLIMGIQSLQLKHLRKFLLQQHFRQMILMLSILIEGHFARQCTKPKRPMNSAWIKEKMLLTEALKSGAYLDPKQLAFLADNGDTITPAQASQEILTPSAFQTDDLDAFNSDYDKAPSAKAVLIPVFPFMIQMFFQSFQSTSSSAQQDALIMSVNEEMSSQVAKCNKAPTLYDGHTIVKTNVALSVPDTEETLKLAEKTRLKMLDKQNDPSLKKHKVNLKPVDYVALNKLSEHFAKRFVPQKQLSAEPAYWLPILQPVVVKQPVSSERVLKKEIPRVLPTISIVKLFDHGLNKEIKEIKAVFNQIETEVSKCFVDKKYFKIEKKEASLNNDRLLEHIICQDVMNVVIHVNDHHENVLHANNNSLVYDNSALDRLKHENDRLTELLISQDLVHIAVNSVDILDMSKSCVDECNKCLSQEKDTVIRKFKDRIKSLSGKDSMEKVKKDMDAIETIKIELEHNLNAQLQEKVFAIAALKNELRKPKGKNVVYTVVSAPIATIIALGMFKLDIKPISHRLKNIRDVHEEYLKKTIENTHTIPSKTKSWLWHRRLSHLNFGTLNQLAKQGLVRGLPKLKFEKDHLCSACSLRKSKKSSHKPKADDTNQENLNLLHMDLCRSSLYNMLYLKSFPNTSPLCKTPYELMHDKKPDLSYLHVFGSLCYPTNDSEDLGKFKAKTDIGIFVGYAPFSSGPASQVMTPGTLNSGLVPNLIPQPPVVSPVYAAAARRPTDPTGSPVSTSFEQDTPSGSTS